VRSKRFRQFQFDSEQVFRRISVRLTAVVAAYVEAAIQIGRRLKRVGFAERDLVFKKEILVLVEFVVLAEYNPEILAFESHSVLQVPPRA
jgi:hypothetical protein